MFYPNNTTKNTSISPRHLEATTSRLKRSTACASFWRCSSRLASKGSTWARDSVFTWAVLRAVEYIYIYMGIQIGILRLNSHPQKEKHTILNDGFPWAPTHFPWISHPASPPPGAHWRDVPHQGGSRPPWPWQLIGWLDCWSNTQHLRTHLNEVDILGIRLERSGLWSSGLICCKKLFQHLHASGSGQIGQRLARTWPRLAKGPAWRNEAVLNGTVRKCGQVDIQDNVGNPMP